MSVDGKIPVERLAADRPGRRGDLLGGARPDLADEGKTHGIVVFLFLLFVLFLFPLFLFPLFEFPLFLGQPGEIEAGQRQGGGGKGVALPSASALEKAEQRAVARRGKIRIACHARLQHFAHRPGCPFVVGKLERQIAPRSGVLRLGPVVFAHGGAAGVGIAEEDAIAIAGRLLRNADHARLADRIVECPIQLRLAPAGRTVGAGCHGAKARRALVSHVEHHAPVGKLHRAGLVGRDDSLAVVRHPVADFPRNPVVIAQQHARVRRPMSVSAHLGGIRQPERHQQAAVGQLQSVPAPVADHAPRVALLPIAGDDVGDLPGFAEGPAIIVAL